MTRLLATRSIGPQIRTLRQQLGWSQRELGRRAQVSQALVSAVETERVQDLTFHTADRLLAAMGARLIVSVDVPYMADRQRQLEPAHARCTWYVATRLRRDDWDVRTEVEVGDDRSRGWIDVLAYHQRLALLLVIEIKTEIRDFGAIERTLGWYERAAGPAADRFGWRPQSTRGCLLLLATQANDARVATLGGSFALGFSGRARDLGDVVAGIAGSVGPGRAAAMIDPRSRRRAWLRPLRLDGRRSLAPYVDYADFMRALGPTGLGRCDRSD